MRFKKTVVKKMYFVTILPKRISFSIFKFIFQY